MHFNKICTFHNIHENIKYLKKDCLESYYFSEGS